MIDGLGDLLWRSSWNDAALLPSRSAVHLWQSLSWAVVTAFFVGWIADKLNLRIGWQRTLVLLALVVAWLPGPWSSSYWLCLAFQTPSLVSVALSCVVLIRCNGCGSHVQRSDRVLPTAGLFLIIAGIALGWVLLLDTLGFLPGSVYQLGFGNLAAAIAVMVVMAPWALTPSVRPGLAVGVCIGAILTFTVTQLPTGNVFDALLDPWLWIFLHCSALANKSTWRRARAR